MLRLLPTDLDKQQKIYNTSYFLNPNPSQKIFRDHDGLKGVLFQLLNEQMNDQLFSWYEPSTFEALISLALKIDDRLNEKNLNRHYNQFPVLGHCALLPEVHRLSRCG